MNNPDNLEKSTDYFDEINNIENKSIISRKGMKYLYISKKNSRKKMKKTDNFRYLKKFLIIIIVFFIFSFLIGFKGKYNYCWDCVKKVNNLTQQCYQCPLEFLYKNLVIESDENTINEILVHNKSIGRYGDGEYAIIFGHSISFQKYDEILAKRLKEILISDDKNILVGIYFPFRKKELDLYRDFEVRYWRSFCNGYKFKMLKILNLNKRYYSMGITKFYLKLKDVSKLPKYISNLRKIWGGRDVLMIEGGISRQGIGNDLFDNVNSMKRIICPERHSFSVYGQILSAVLEFDKNILVLISLGPTATVLAYDLSKLGYQAIDIGHVDLEYELYLRNATTWIFKDEKKEEKNETEMNQYRSQIIKTIFINNTIVSK